MTRGISIVNGIITIDTLSLNADWDGGLIRILIDPITKYLSIDKVDADEV